MSRARYDQFTKDREVGFVGEKGRGTKRFLEWISFPGEADSSTVRLLSYLVYDRVGVVVEVASASAAAARPGPPQDAAEEPQKLTYRDIEHAIEVVAGIGRAAAAKPEPTDAALLVDADEAHGAAPFHAEQLQPQLLQLRHSCPGSSGVLQREQQPLCA